MSFDRDESQVDDWLRAKGVQHGIRHLIGHRALCREIIPTLLELFRQPFSLGTRAAVAEALFGCGPAEAERREVMGVLLEILKTHAGEEVQGPMLRLVKMVAGATLVDGLLVDNIDATHVHEVGELILDNRFGDKRVEFTFALRKIGNAEAVSYLELAAKDPQIAYFALTALISLGRQEKFPALLEEALEVPGLVNKARIEGLRTGFLGALLYQKEKADVEARLKASGVPHDLHDLYQNPALSPDCAPVLLEIFESPISTQMRAVIADALFFRKPIAEQKRRAVETMLKIVRENMGKYDHCISTLVLNELANNVSADLVHEIGQMIFDERYGQLRSELTHVLYHIGNADAIGYLIRAAKEPVTASLALDGLARLRVPETGELCEAALKNPKIHYKDAIRDTYKKFKRKQAKKAAALSHLTKEPIPGGLEEWSTNLDGSDLTKMLRAIQKCVEAGFGKAETAEVRAAADDLAPEEGSSTQPETARLKFEVQFGGAAQTLWLEVFCDDEEAFDLYVFASPDLIKTIDGALSKLLPE